MAILNGTNATDFLSGGNPGDTISGLDGDDVLEGFGGPDKIYGGVGDDELYGMDGADVLKGGSGYDYFVGGLGFDRIDGGSTLDPTYPSWWTEIDTVSYYSEGGDLGVTVSLVTGTATDTFGNIDTLIDIERVAGTASADTLSGGNASNDSFEGFTGFGGADRISGGSGWDVAEYYSDRDEGGYGGIVADLSAGTIRDGFGDVDTVSGIEEVRASHVSDDLKGSSGDDEFLPFGGNDLIDGGLGSDTVSYSLDVWRDGTKGIFADLTNGLVTDTGGWIDKVISIENVRGSFWDDSILGDAGGNFLAGLEGADVVKGRAGTDTLYGDEGNDALFGGLDNDELIGGSGVDTLRGGAGNDTFFIYSDSDTDIISDFRTGQDKLNVSSFGFATKTEVMSRLTVISADTAILDLGNDTFVEFHNVKTGSTYFTLNDLII